MIHAGSADVKGRVLIVWVSNDTIEATKEALMNAVQMFSAMPFILSDIHICVIGGQATTHMKPSLISQFELRIEMTKAVRVNSHHGMYLGRKFKLQHMYTSPVPLHFRYFVGGAAITSGIRHSVIRVADHIRWKPSIYRREPYEMGSKTS